mgnify:CR=1 FL=1
MANVAHPDYPSFVERSVSVAERGSRRANPVVPVNVITTHRVLAALPVDGTETECPAPQDRTLCDVGDGDLLMMVPDESVDPHNPTDGEDYPLCHGSACSVRAGTMGKLIPSGFSKATMPAEQGVYSRVIAPQIFGTLTVPCAYQVLPGDRLVAVCRNSRVNPGGKFSVVPLRLLNDANVQQSLHPEDVLVSGAARADEALVRSRIVGVALEGSKDGHVDILVKSF